MRNARLMMVVGLLVALVFASVAHSDLFTAVDTSTVAEHSNMPWGQTWGWSFTVAEPMDLSAMGIYDHEGDGLTSDHEVLLWRNSDEALLGSVTVGSGDAPDGHFVFKGLVSPVSLDPLETYTLVATYPSGQSDAFGWNNDTSPLTFAPGVNWAGEREYDYDDVTAFPAVCPDGYYDIGPNMRLTTASGLNISATPEPGTILLGMLTVLGGLGARRRAGRNRECGK